MKTLCLVAFAVCLIMCVGFLLEACDPINTRDEAMNLLLSSFIFGVFTLMAASVLIAFPQMP